MLHQGSQQDSFKNLRICTPVSTDDFPVRSPQVMATYASSASQAHEGDMDGRPPTVSPGSLGQLPGGAQSTSDPSNEQTCEGKSTSTDMKVEDPALVEQGNLVDSEKQSETNNDLQGAAAGAKTEEPYAQLLYRALMGAPGHAMTLQEIYKWFGENTDKTKGEGKGWQNSIRHNLSMNLVS